MAKVPDEVLDEMVQIIVEAIDPEKIILFGSQATGKPDANSDVDIIVVDSKSYDKKRSRISVLGELLRQLFNFPGPLDILLYTKDEIDERLRLQQHIVKDAFSTGKILYERN